MARAIPIDMKEMKKQLAEINKKDLSDLDGVEKAEYLYNTLLTNDSLKERGISVEYSRHLLQDAHTFLFKSVGRFLHGCSNITKQAIAAHISDESMLGYSLHDLKRECLDTCSPALGLPHIAESGIIPNKVIKYTVPFLIGWPLGKHEHYPVYRRSDKKHVGNIWEDNGQWVCLDQSNITREKCFDYKAQAANYLYQVAE